MPNGERRHGLEAFLDAFAVFKGTLLVPGGGGRAASSRSRPSRPREDAGR